MAKQKKLEKAAAKALDHAEEAVAAARKAAEKLDTKKAKKRAEEVQRQLDDIRPDKKAPKDKKATKGTKAAKGTKPGKRDTGATTSGSPAIDLTPPLPSVRDDQVEETVEFAGSVTTSAPHDPELDTLTLQALRDVARSRGLRNTSRLTKGQLIERLSE